MWLGSNFDNWLETKTLITRGCEVDLLCYGVFLCTGSEGPLEKLHLK